jgi:hypothetical protein
LKCEYYPSQHIRLQTLDRLFEGLYYYKQIRSVEKDVDNFYNNFLPRYFKAEENYGVEQESRLSKLLGTSRRADFIIRTIKNGIPKRIIFLEDKRKEHETQDAVWTDALAQVTSYASVIRAETGQDPKANIIYLTVNIGTYLRFYELHPNESTACDFAPAGGRLFELADNEEEIHQLFTMLHDRTVH